MQWYNHPTCLSLMRQGRESADEFYGRELIRASTLEDKEHFTVPRLVPIKGSLVKRSNHRSPDWIPGQ